MQEINPSDAILDKIKKLLNKAASTNSEEEAQTATALARQMLMKYNLDMSMVDNHKVKDKNSVTENLIDLDEQGTKVDGGWLISLLNYLCLTHFCKLIQINARDKVHGHGCIIGKDVNIETVKMLYHYLVPVGKNLANKRFNEYSNSGGGEKRNTWKRGYYKGFAFAIFERLKKEEEIEKKDLTLEPQMTALVLVNNKAIADYVGDRFKGALRTGKAPKTKSRDGRSFGYQDGSNISLNKQVGSSNNSNRLN